MKVDDDLILKIIFSIRKEVSFPTSSTGSSSSFPSNTLALVSKLLFKSSEEKKSVLEQNKKVIDTESIEINKSVSSIKEFIQQIQCLFPAEMNKDCTEVVNDIISKNISSTCSIEKLMNELFKHPNIVSIYSFYF
jgi:hypothetical protein